MLKPLSESASRVRASTTMTIDAMYKQMRADGADVLGFGAGEPDFDTPESIKNSGIDAINKNLTRYTPASGTESLRKAICARLEKDYGLAYKPSQIVVSSGAKHNLYLAMRALIDPGDEIILTAPYWVSYDEQIRMCGGVSVILKTTGEEGFALSADRLEAAITPKTKALILNSPSNPTGMVYTREQLLALAQVCVKHGLYIVSDEIYGNLVYGGAKFHSVAALGEEIKEHTVVINGVSKSYAMTGWRVGYSASPQGIATVMANYQSHSTSSPSTISQAAAEDALSGNQDSVETMRAAFEHRRDLFIELAQKIPGVKCRKPDGAFYVMLDVSSSFGKSVDGAVIDGADGFAQLLLKKAMVAVVPCEGFGAPEYVRMSYAVSDAVIEKGLGRIGEFMKQLS